MPLAVFAMLVFGICNWLAAGAVEVVMRNFAGEVGVPVWVFVIVPGLFAMLFALFLYRRASSDIKGIKQSLARALTVALLTWLAVVTYTSTLWCPGYRVLGCVRDVALLTAAIGGGPLVLAVLVSGAIVGVVLKRRVTWLSYRSSGKLAE